jgi:hypothetical protein
MRQNVYRYQLGIIFKSPEELIAAPVPHMIFFFYGFLLYFLIFGTNYSDRFTCMFFFYLLQGLFYNCYPNWDVSKAQGKDATSLEFQTVFYHVLGTTQDKVPVS